MLDLHPDEFFQGRPRYPLLLEFEPQAGRWVYNWRWFFPGINGSVLKGMMERKEGRKERGGQGRSGATQETGSDGECDNTQG